MGLFSRQRWINFLALLPGTVLTILGIAVAFLRFYDQNDFRLLGRIAQPRTWSNRLTVAALLAALVNFGIEWNRRNRETDRLAAEANRRSQEKQRSAEEEQRRREDAARAATERAEEAKRTARRARIEARCRAVQIRFQLDPGPANRQRLTTILALLDEYGETL